VKLGLKLPETSIGTSYGTSALKVKGRLFVRLKEAGVAIGGAEGGGEAVAG
jgi:hypothetical protein